jgi:hypothetical protein
VCEACDALQEDVGACTLCAGPTRALELGEGMTERVLTAGGATARVDDHAGLAAVGGVAARLRYPV